MKPPAPPQPPTPAQPQNPAVAWIDEAVATPQGRAALCAALAARPALLGDAVAMVRDRAALQQVVRNPALLLPIEPPYPRPHAAYRKAGDFDAALHRLLRHHRFDSVLVAGPEAEMLARLFLDFGKRPTLLLTDPPPADPAARAEEHLRLAALRAEGIEALHAEAPPRRAFDCVVAHDMLQRAPDAQFCLSALIDRVHERGVFCVSVPPARFELTGGTLSIWTPGLLLCAIVRAGLDCSDADLLHCGGSIAALVRARPIELPPLSHGPGDIDRLKPFLPPGFAEGANGFQLARRA